MPSFLGRYDIYEGGCAMEAYANALCHNHMTPDELRLLAEQYEPPVDPVKIARTAGIAVYLTDFKPEDGENIAGSVVIHNGTPEIYVAKSHPHVRKRFTVAHEVAHIMLGHLTDKDGELIEDEVRLRSAARDQKERDANAYAADLLMPYAMMRDAVASGIRDIDRLASLFGVSTQAMRIRINNIAAGRVK